MVIFALPNNNGAKVLISSASLAKAEMVKSESSSFGRARPCQGRGGRFEPGLSLWIPSSRWRDGLFFGTSPGGGIGRHAGLKILFAATRVRVQFPPGALDLQSLREIAMRGLFLFLSEICLQFAYN